MTPEQQSLYATICQFELDDPAADFPFSVKLAWEYQWTAIYTYRAIQEYKKFMFLAAIAGQEIAPSTAVDRVWHLHLLYTRSYWDEFCGQVLQKNLHHFPGKGGVNAGLKYYYQYCRTLDLYCCYFHQPPEDIWNQPRFKSEGALFQWVNRNDYWVLAKPKALLRMLKPLRPSPTLWKASDKMVGNGQPMASKSDQEKSE